MNHRCVALFYAYYLIQQSDYFLILLTGLVLASLPAYCHFSNFNPFNKPASAALVMLMA
jgi:hypothetical protein